MRVLEGQAEAEAGIFNAQEVANTLWAYATMGREAGAVLILVLEGQAEAGCFNTCELRQLHQFFLWFSLEPRLRVEPINDMRSLKAACRSAFECRETVPSATQQQVSETLRILGLAVEVEVRSPKSGYSIDMLVHDSSLEIGGEWSSGGGSWAVGLTGLRPSLERGTNGGHTAEATASATAGSRSRSVP
jgi:hypothetical protein